MSDNEPSQKDAWDPPAKHELVAMLKLCPAGIEEFEKLRNEHPKWVPDLSLANLPQADLKGANLSFCNFEGANLRGAKLQSAIMKQTLLQDANLSWASLHHTNLSGARLENANLEYASLCHADLSNAWLTNAKTDGVNWWCTKITGAIRINPMDIILCLVTHQRAKETL